MALWQVDVVLIPEEAIHADVCKLDDSAMDSGDWWQGRECVADVIRNLDAWLPRAPSGAHVWGTREGTCAEIIAEEPNLQDVLIRLDMKTFTADDIASLLTLLRECRLKMCLVETGRLCSEEEDVKEALRVSAAAKFVVDPRGFIRDCARRHAEGLDQER